MPFSIDFKWVKEQVSPAHAIELLELNVRKHSPGQWRMDCPVCDRERVLVYTDCEGFTCHGPCQISGGDQFALAQFVLDLSRPWDAFREMADRAGIPYKRHGTVQRTRTVRTANIVPESEKPRGRKAGSPPRGGGRSTPPPQPARRFDPDAFGQKLEYTDEVMDLGISEEDAEALGIGFYRGKLYQALRYSNGEIAGYSSFAHGELKLPAQLIPMTNVVPLRKRA